MLKWKLLTTERLETKNKLKQTHPEKKLAENSSQFVRVQQSLDAAEQPIVAV